jgi:hypothetical protein
MSDAVYERLAAPFDHVFTDTRGGVALTYITGEQVIKRLNEALGVAGWSFTIKDHGIHADEEMWALGSLEAKIDGEHVVKEQFGSQKIKRSKSTGMPLDIGFDLKGAATDSLKKCASLLGVGLYLSQRNVDAPRTVSTGRVCSICGTDNLRRGGFKAGKAFCAQHWTSAA